MITHNGKKNTTQRKEESLSAYLGIKALKHNTISNTALSLQHYCYLGQIILCCGLPCALSDV
jgi:hypothetical protein